MDSLKFGSYVDDCIQFYPYPTLKCCMVEITPPGITFSTYLLTKEEIEQIVKFLQKLLVVEDEK